MLKKQEKVIKTAKQVEKIKNSYYKQKQQQFKAILSIKIAITGKSYQSPSKSYQSSHWIKFKKLGIFLFNWGGGGAKILKKGCFRVSSSNRIYTKF